MLQMMTLMMTLELSFTDGRFSVLYGTTSTDVKNEGSQIVVTCFECIQNILTLHEKHLTSGSTSYLPQTCSLELQEQ